MKTLLKSSLLLATLCLIVCDQSAKTETNLNAATDTLKSEKQADLPVHW